MPAPIRPAPAVPMTPPESSAPDSVDAAAAAGSTGGDGRAAAGRRGRGRPRLRPGQGDLVRVEFKVSAAERDRIRTMAGTAGLSVSEFLRRRAFGAPVVAAAESIVRDAVRTELGRIGANLNQLVRRANEAGPLVPAERGAVVAAVVAEAEGLLRELGAVRDELGAGPRASVRRGSPVTLPLPPGRGGDGDVSYVRGPGGSGR